MPVKVPEKLTTTKRVTIDGFVIKVRQILDITRWWHVDGESRPCVYVPNLGEVYLIPGEFKLTRK